MRISRAGPLRAKERGKFETHCVIEQRSKTYANPHLGTHGVDQIDTPDVLRVLAPIWLTKPETARRVRQRIATVLNWAKAAGHRSGDNPVESVAKGLPKQTDTVEHHAALPFTQAPAFAARLHADRGEITKLAFESLILTVLRTGEVLSARWEEIDTDEAAWTVPAQRMKMKRAHLVPLSPGALAILERGKLLAGDSPYVFPGQKPGEDAVEHGVRDGSSADAGASNGARLPLLVPRLGGGDDVIPERGRRDGAGARRREPGRGGLPTRRPLGEAARVDGLLVSVPIYAVSTQRST